MDDGRWRVDNGQWSRYSGEKRFRVEEEGSIMENDNGQMRMNNIGMRTGI